MIPRLFLLIACLILAFPHRAAADEPVHAPETVPAVIEIRGLTSISEEELLYLLGIARGRSIDRAALRAGLRRAYLKGIFDDITIEMPDEAKDRLLITVRERPVIGSIEIAGNEYFSTRFLRKNLTVEKGERLSHRRLAAAMAKLAREMAVRGYSRAAVTYDLKPLGPSATALHVTVREGQPDVIGKITISEPDDVVSSYLKLSAGDVYDATKMEATAEKVMKYYKKEGFVKTTLTYLFTDGMLDITLMRGQRLVVNFEGNTVFSSGRLRKEVPFFEINDYSNDLLEETAGRLLALYHDKGYAFAQVTPITVLRDDGIDITFFLFEGEKNSVSSVTFTGASINQERLRATLANRPGQRYNPDLMERDRQTLEEFYRALGYLRVEVPEPEISMDNAEVSIHYTVREGIQMTVREIALSGNRSVSDAEIRSAISIREGSPYNDVDIAEARARIDDLYDKKGFLDVRVDVERDMHDDGASLRFRITEGTPLRFGKTIVVGNDQTKLKVITREFQHREGNPYDFGLLLKDRHSLQKLGLFSDIDVVPQDAEGDRKDVIYRLRESPAGTVDFAVGYAEYERLRGFFDVSYRNLGGMNRQVSFRTELSSLLQRLTLSYTEPWFMDRKLPFKALLLYEKKEEVNIDSRDVLYRSERALASAGVMKKIREKYDAELYYDFSVVKTYDVQPDVILSRNDVGTQVISGFRPGLLYDTRDNPFAPQKGVFAGLSCKITSKLFLSETEFIKLSAFGNTYLKLSDRFVLALSLRGGLATGFGDTKELPIVERFFLGGRTTVRGYDQDELGPKGSDGNPTGGNAFLMGNIEVRTDVGKGFGIVTFLDGGNVWQLVEDMKIGDIKYTVGIGLRYNTPVGPLRVDYGHKLDRENGESSGEIHFSLGHAF